MNTQKLRLFFCEVDNLLLWWKLCQLCNGPWYKKPESAMSTIIKLVKLNATLSQPHTINEEIMLQTQDFLTNETWKYQCSMQSGSAFSDILIEKKLSLLKPTYYSPKNNK